MRHGLEPGWNLALLLTVGTLSMGPQKRKVIDKVLCPVLFLFKGVRLITHSHKFTLKCLRKEGWENDKCHSQDTLCPQDMKTRPLTHKIETDEDSKEELGLRHIMICVAFRARRHSELVTKVRNGS